MYSNDFEDFEDKLTFIQNDDLISSNVSSNEREPNESYWISSGHEASIFGDLLFPPFPNTSHTGDTLKYLNLPEEPELLGKKRGKKSKLENDVNYKEHTKYKADNVNRKIKVDSLNSLITFLNCIMLAFGLDYSFKNLDYYYKKTIKKGHPIFDLKIFKSKKIKDILSEAPISRKYTKLSKTYNKNIIEQIEANVHNQYLLNLLNQNYLFFFKNIYYKNLEKICINDKEIDLTKNVKTFKDIIKSSSNVDNKYKEELEKKANKYYIA